MGQRIRQPVSDFVQKRSPVKIYGENLIMTQHPNIHLIELCKRYLDNLKGEGNILGVDYSEDNWNVEYKKIQDDYLYFVSKIVTFTCQDEDDDKSWQGTETYRFTICEDKFLSIDSW
ncbi:hypothetical protein [Gloeothece verrucosa]|uniref:Uncharacterized protein n=1 Tax=Gloeothece verrucosa (strain PCC 7822) TaxID=497965 RepID=E0U6Y8_GLOV7|nr:hypothetical protein [Gloeothece verrucosa]ADN16025.1 hypothetical protein Cyan7822_4105 [Gloeothece verrucosa PCC 7822]